VSNFWQRLFGRPRREAIEREIEQEGMSPEERGIARESVEDLASDRFVEEHLGGGSDLELQRPEPEDY
jgi:hypothetical protein